MTNVRFGGTTPAALDRVCPPPIVAASALGAPVIENANRSLGGMAPVAATVGGGAGDAEGVLPLFSASSAMAITTTTSATPTAAWIFQRFSTRADRNVRDGRSSSSLIGRAPPPGCAPPRLREQGTGSAAPRARGGGWRSS